MRLYNYHRNTFYLSNIEHKSLLLHLISEEPDPEEYPVALIIHTEGRSPDASTLSMPGNGHFQYWCRFTTENQRIIQEMIESEYITPTFDEQLSSNRVYNITSVEINDINIKC